MKLSDYVADFLAKQGVEHVFGLTGGAVVHLFDSVARHGRLEPIFTHHEQGAAYAAEAYAKARRDLGVCMVTTGPGVTNALTGLAGAWLDSVPCVFISGQARYAHTTHDKRIRQLGTQQLDVLPIVQSMTKYAVMLEEPSLIRYHLEKAVYLARNGRPGPVWIDLPLDFQWGNIEPEALRSFDPLQEMPHELRNVSRVPDVLRLLSEAKRPLMLFGYGLHAARAEKEVQSFIDTFQLPFVTTWGTRDLVPSDHPLCLGFPGISGQRGANLAVQNCDFLLAVGSHLCIPLTGTNFPSFAREAKIVVVDIDPEEIGHRTIPVVLGIACDAKVFVKEMMSSASHGSVRPPHASWVQHCRKFQALNRLPPECFADKPEVDHYAFIDALSDALDGTEPIVVDGGGTTLYISYHAFKLKRGQRMIGTTGLSAMGSGVPEAVGVCLALGRPTTICTVGDGSFQLNVQELQTIAHHKLPIKIFVFNNQGYNAIRQTQRGFLGGRYYGSAPDGGMTLPDIGAVALAYRLPAVRVTTQAEIRLKISEVMSIKGPVVCEVVVSPDQPLIPSPGFDLQPDGTFRARPLEDMAPYLDREEFSKLMLVPPFDG